MKNLFTIGCTILFALNLIQIGSTEPSFELREGECDETSNGTASGEDLVYKDRITLESLPFFSRTEEVSTVFIIPEYNVGSSSVYSDVIANIIFPLSRKIGQ